MRKLVCIITASPLRIQGGPMLLGRRKKKRHQQDLNLRSETETDIQSRCNALESVALTTRP